MQVDVEVEDAAEKRGSERTTKLRARKTGNISGKEDERKGNRCECWLYCRRTRDEIETRISTEEVNKIRATGKALLL